MKTDEQPYSRGAGGADAGTLRMVLAQGQSFLNENFPSATASISTNDADDSDAVLLHASDVSIQHTMLVNEANKPAYVKLGSLASETDYSFVLGAFETYVLPFRYTGSLSARWGAGVDTALKMRTTILRA